MPTSINDEEFEILSPVILQLSTCLPTFLIIKMYLSSIIMLAVGIILVGYYKGLCFWPHYMYNTIVKLHYIFKNLHLLGVESLILRWPLRPMGLLFFCSITLKLKHCNIFVDWTQHAASRWTITCFSAIYSGWIKIYRQTEWNQTYQYNFISIPPEDKNGLAESLVQGFKQAIKKDTKNIPMNIRLNRFLCTHCSTPHPTTGESSSKLLLGRNIRTQLDLIEPSVQDAVQQQNQHMTPSKHTGSEVREFCTAQHMMVSVVNVMDTLNICGKIRTTYLPGQNQWRWNLEATHKSNAENFTWLRMKKNLTNPRCNTEADLLQSCELMFQRRPWRMLKYGQVCQWVYLLVVRPNKQKFVRSQSVQSQ